MRGLVGGICGGKGELRREERERAGRRPDGRMVGSLPMPRLASRRALCFLSDSLALAACQQQMAAIQDSLSDRGVQEEYTEELRRLLCLRGGLVTTSVEVLTVSDAMSDPMGLGERGESRGSGRRGACGTCSASRLTATPRRTHEPLSLPTL